jgi:hypothetical protein
MGKLITCLIILVGLSTQTYGQTICKNSSAHISILIDLSEPLDQPTAIAYTTLSGKIINSLPSGGVLNLYVMKSNAEEVERKSDYEFCIPDFNGMKGEKYRERAKKKFENEVFPIMEKIGVTITSAKKSPILENIFKISHRTFLKAPPNDNNTMIVISDFVQFSELANFYKDIPSYQAFSDNRQLNSWLPKIKNVKMHLIMLNNASSSNMDSKKIRSFWLDYARNNFKQCGFSGINEASVSFKNEC